MILDPSYIQCGYFWIYQLYIYIYMQKVDINKQKNNDW